ncbi:MAG: ATP-dependent helicase, partial [Ruminococcus sp.]|nr:ATP-dependent helicase [Ruminococcus sp.]
LFLNVMSILNENWFERDKWNEKTQIAVNKYKNVFYDKNYFDYSLIMQEMLNQLETNKDFADLIIGKVKYLTVDEYQDINSIQERLIHFMKEGGCNLCIVGDDDQTIYQFRGSDPENILTFRERYGIEKYIVLDKDYRRSEAIIDIARRTIINNEKRLPKQMVSGALFQYEEGDTVYREFEETVDEYNFISGRIKSLHEIGIKYSEMAILLRKRKHGPELAKILEEYGIPFIIEGVNELFSTLECQAAKGIFDYLAGAIGMTELFQMWKNIECALDEKEIADAIATLDIIEMSEKKYYGDFVLQKVYHEFLRKLSIMNNPENGKTEIILYNLGKFSQVIQDFETIHFATLPQNKLKNFCNFLQYTASGYYPEGYIANTYIRPDAVNIMTVHQSKGLEFTAVFIPQLNHNNFPSAKMGGKGIWHVIEKDWILNAERFAGGIEEERKLFYVAVTRAKKFLFLTRSPGNAREKKVSEFMVEAKNSPYLLGYDSQMHYTNDHLPKMNEESAPINLNFSILQDYFECAYRFKLSMFYGFVQPIVPKMGYGKAMHEIVRNIHKRYLAGEQLTDGEITDIVENSFYLPYANPKLEANMLEGAKKTTLEYVVKNRDDFDKITMAEADIELDMGDGIKVNGRIDLVKRREISGEEKTYIVDFKTASRDVTECIHTEQLKIYALGYQKLTGESADYLEIYNLDNSESERQRVTEGLLDDVSRDIRTAAMNIRNNKLPRKCSKKKCQECYLNYLCLSRKEKREFGV